MRTFNYIKESFESIAPSLYTKSGGKKYIAKYAKTIRESNNLKTLHKMCEAVRVGDREGDAKEYVKDVINFCGRVDESYKTDIEKLNKVLEESIKFLGEDSKTMLSEEKDVNVAIEYVASHDKGLKNLVEYNKNTKIVENYILEHGNRYESKPSSNGLSQDNIDSIEEKCVDLNESEREIVKMVISGNIEDAFAEGKRLCVESLSKKLLLASNEEEKEVLQKVYENVNKKEYSEDTVNSDILNFINLAKTIA